MPPNLCLVASTPLGHVCCLPGPPVSLAWHSPRAAQVNLMLQAVGAEVEDLRAFIEALAEERETLAAALSAAGGAAAQGSPPDVCLG